jgi:hypothetical protein
MAGRDSRGHSALLILVGLGLATYPADLAVLHGAGDPVLLPPRPCAHHRRPSPRGDHTGRALRGLASHLGNPYPGRSHADDIRTGRATLFASLEARGRFGPIIQREFDVTFFPRAVPRSAEVAGHRHYTAVVVRAAVEAEPVLLGGRPVVGLEGGLASGAPRRAVLGTGGPEDGRGDGWAFQNSANQMGMRNSHSLGIVHSQTGVPRATKGPGRPRAHHDPILRLDPRCWGGAKPFFRASVPCS